MINDLFPRDKRALPVACFVGVSIVMGPGALIAGSVALDLAGSLAPAVGWSPWRGALYLVAIPGLILALLFLLTVREPSRPPVTGHKSYTNLLTFFTHFAERAYLYAPLFLGIGLSAMMQFSILSWMPTLMVRGYGLEPASGWYTLGAIGILGGLAGVFAWPWWRAGCRRRGHAACCRDLRSQRRSRSVE